MSRYQNKNISRYSYLRLLRGIILVMTVIFVMASWSVQAATLDLPMIDPGKFGYSANVGETSSCTCTPPSSWPTLCDYNGETSNIKDTMLTALEEELLVTGNELERWIGDTLIDGMMSAFLLKLNNNETNLMDWWDTFWFYNFYPALQEVAESVVTAQQDQVRSQGASADAELRQEQEQEIQVQSVEDERTLRPSENVCVMATTAGGQGQASNFAKAMQTAWEKESKYAGSNKAGTPGATGKLAAEKARHDLYETTFCDPNDNNGHNVCGTPGPNTPLPASTFYNADTQITKTILDRKTIPIDQDKRYGDAVQAGLDNMLGPTSADNIPPEAISTAEGKEVWLKRRTYLARAAAIRALPQLSVGWRVPGSGLGPWVSELRKSAGTPDPDISGNPSYREVLYATAVERFNTGKFAGDMITDPLVVEREKLALDTIYLMQLRDYYELLERQALTLAIQVAILAEQTPVSSLISEVKITP